jgi:hypothetical protein
MQGISLLVEEPLAPQEGLCSMELISLSISQPANSDFITT